MTAAPHRFTTGDAHGDDDCAPEGFGVLAALDAIAKPVPRVHELSNAQRWNLIASLARDIAHTTDHADEMRLAKDYHYVAAHAAGSFA